MEKEELKQLTVDKLKDLSLEELDALGSEVEQKLTDSEIKSLPKDVRKALGFNHTSMLLSKEFWITILLGGVGLVIAQAILRK